MTPEELSAVLKPLVDAIKNKDWWDKSPAVLTGLSFLVVAYTTWLTMKMKDCAEKQTKSAQDMMKEAQKQTILQVRPVLILEPSTTYPSGAGDINAKCCNVGRGPAFDVVFKPIQYECPDDGKVMILFLSSDSLIPEGAERSVRIQVVSDLGKRRLDEHSVPLFDDDPEDCDLDRLSSLTLRRRLPDPLIFSITFRDLFGGRHESRLMMRKVDEDKFTFDYLPSRDSGTET